MCGDPRSALVVAADENPVRVRVHETVDGHLRVRQAERAHHVARGPVREPAPGNDDRLGELPLQVRENGLFLNNEDELWRFRGRDVQDRLHGDQRRAVPPPRLNNVAVLQRDRHVAGKETVWRRHDAEALPWHAQQPRQARNGAHDVALVAKEDHILVVNIPARHDLVRLQVTEHNTNDAQSPCKRPAPRQAAREAEHARARPHHGLGDSSGRTHLAWVYSELEAADFRAQLRLETRNHLVEMGRQAGATHFCGKGGGGCRGGS